MKLIGSSTSPYVRRIRLLLADAGQGYEFSDLNIYGEDRDQLRRQNPALKIPVLYDGDEVIYDSRVIFRYLQEKLGLAPISWKQENLLTIIDAANDSMVAILLSQRSGLDTGEDRLYFNLQRERVEKSLQALDQRVDEGEFGVWDYPSICLYSMFDWGLFRGLIDAAQYPHLAAWLAEQREQTGVANSDPRDAA
ncbi:glutathione S-transferase family protein [Marinobacterium sp. D7]|uniref:glutathione S-transferase family protein n=1 Tax=Marinobacterium ramblicola TaxID=2849041 RepID=UPI001C2CD608|nr:glutathione S-transferase family protein [Marinobacterium ramblicola]MBV1790578.1 glutathione S-transferase family protein [Marinobacterium ramblicola]